MSGFRHLFLPPLQVETVTTPTSIIDDALLFINHLNSSAGAGGNGSVGMGRVFLGEAASVNRDTAILGEGNVESAIIPPSGEDNGESSEADDEEQVEDTEPDEAGSNTNDITAIRQTPCNGIDEPEEVGIAGKLGVVAADANMGGVPAAVDQSRVEEEEMSEETPGEEAPLVVGWSVGGGEVAELPDPGEEDVKEDGGPGDTGEDTKSDNDGGEGDNPEDILGPEDLTGETASVDLVRLRDHIPAEIAGLGIVGDETDKGGDDEEVVEEAFTVAGLELVGEKAQCGDTEEGGDGKEPVGAIVAEVLVASRRRVRAPGVVAWDNLGHVDLVSVASWVRGGL